MEEAEEVEEDEEAKKKKRTRRALVAKMIVRPKKRCNYIFRRYILYLSGGKAPRE